MRKPCSRKCGESYSLLRILAYRFNPTLGEASVVLSGFFYRFSPLFRILCAEAILARLRREQLFERSVWYQKPKDITLGGWNIKKDSNLQCTVILNTLKSNSFNSIVNWAHQETIKLFLNKFFLVNILFTIQSGYIKLNYQGKENKRRYDLSL